MGEPLSIAKKELLKAIDRLFEFQECRYKSFLMDQAIKLSDDEAIQTACEIDVALSYNLTMKDLAKINDLIRAPRERLRNAGKKRS